MDNQITLVSVYALQASDFYLNQIDEINEKIARFRSCADTRAIAKGERGDSLLQLLGTDVNLRGLRPPPYIESKSNNLNR